MNQRHARCAFFALVLGGAYGCINLPQNAPIAEPLMAFDGSVDLSDSTPADRPDAGALPDADAPRPPLLDGAPPDAQLDMTRPALPDDSGFTDAPPSGTAPPPEPTVDAGDQPRETGEMDGGEGSSPCTPAPEACDGVDNDCDMEVDEGCACAPGEMAPCGTAVGACVPGTQTCGDDGQWGDCEGQISPAAERCDDEDNDCDMRVDEGVVNRCGDCGDLPEEVCEGQADEDCDGAIDEQCPCRVGTVAPCGRDEGECAPGERMCQPAGWGACIGAVGPTAEVCEGMLDEDCDGRVDEGCTCTNGQTRACGDTDVGNCSLGQQDCRNGRWSACAGNINPVAEACDGQDNDCDGQIDEQLLNACGDCGAVPGERCNGEDDDCDGQVDEQVVRACGEDIGECALGQETCVGGEWSECMGGVGAQPETCDERDNDCDGSVDEHRQPEGIQHAQTCDSLDNDCDGEVDEGWPSEAICEGQGEGLYCLEGLVEVCVPGFNRGG